MTRQNRMAVHEDAMNETLTIQTLHPASRLIRPYIADVPIGHQFDDNAVAAAVVDGDWRTPPLPIGDLVYRLESFDGETATYRLMERTEPDLQGWELDPERGWIPPRGAGV